MNLRAIPHWWARHPMLGDAVWAVFVSPFVMASGADLSTLGMGLGIVGLILGFGLLLAMLWRRRHPDVLVVIVLITHLLQVEAVDHPVGWNAVVPIALYAVAAYSTRRRYRWWLVVALAGGLIAGLDWSHSWESTGRWLISVLTTTFFCTAVTAAAWVSGELARQRRNNLQTLRERADALERERDQRSRLAAEEERSRIAREMHDVVAHNLSVIVVQADGAAYAATHGSDPDSRAEVATRALATIGETAREALAETRRLVGVLRSDGEAAEYAPNATLAQIEQLVGRMAEAGVDASYDVSGSPGDHPPLTAGAEMATYRVIQESLTNVVKHGGPGTSVQVSIKHRPEGLAVSIRDTGKGSQGEAGSDGHGHGLIGMRERVAAYGGTLTARDRMAGGFEVLATIPATPVGPGGGGHRPDRTHASERPSEDR